MDYSGIGNLESCDEPKSCCFSATAGAKKYQDGAILHSEGHVGYRDAIAKSLGYSMTLKSIVVLIQHYPWHAQIWAYNWASYTIRRY